MLCGSSSFRMWTSVPVPVCNHCPASKIHSDPSCQPLPTFIFGSAFKMRDIIVLPRPLPQQHSIAKNPTQIRFVASFSIYSIFGYGKPTIWEKKVKQKNEKSVNNKIPCDVLPHGGKYPMISCALVSCPILCHKVACVSRTLLWNCLRLQLFWVSTLLQGFKDSRKFFTENLHSRIFYTMNMSITLILY